MSMIRIWGLYTLTWVGVYIHERDAYGSVNVISLYLYGSGDKHRRSLRWYTCLWKPYPYFRDKYGSREEEEKCFRRRGVCLSATLALSICVNIRHII